MRFKAKQTQGNQNKSTMGRQIAAPQIETGNSVDNNPKEEFKKKKAQKKRRQSREAENRLNRPFQNSSNPNRAQNRGKSTN